MGVGGGGGGRQRKGSLVKANLAKLGISSDKSKVLFEVFLNA